MLLRSCALLLLLAAHLGAGLDAPGADRLVAGGLPSTTHPQGGGPQGGTTGPAASASAAADARSLEERAAALVEQMTLSEKIAQLNTDTPAIERLNVTHWSWWQECLHGLQDRRKFHKGGTFFPQPLGLGATFDTDLVHRMAIAISDELRAKDNEQFVQSGHHMGTSCFGPNINIFRDPRWGRGSETYGEDPLLMGAMAKAFVTGLQGNHSRFLKVGATCKHFAAYSLEQWEGISRFAYDARLDPRDWEDTYSPAFTACVKEARANSVMCSYNAVNGIPTCASSWLLHEELRGDMEFGGFVVSDCGAIDSILQHHEYAGTPAEAAAVALWAGTDVACTDFSALWAAAMQGLVPEERIGDSVRRVLVARMKLGHFDPHESNPWSHVPSSVIGSAEHMALAREAAAKSIVLLKNDPVEAGSKGGKNGGRLLPLNLDSLSRITVVGRLATSSEAMLGNYYGQPWGDITTPLQAIQDYVAAKRPGGTPAVDYMVGTEILGTGASVEPVIAACRRSDVCIFVVGTGMFDWDVKIAERSGTYPLVAPTVEGEDYDRKSLLLPGNQLDLIQAAAKRSSTPIVVLLLHGGPLDVEWLQASPRVSAVLTGWFPGQGAAALADVLFGEVSPSGRLPVTFYYDNYTRQVDFADMSMRRWPGRTHRFLRVPALYPFGHGLSYASFRYRGLAVVQPEGADGSEVEVSVEVQHAGGMAAEEVALAFLSYSLDQQPPQGGGSSSFQLSTDCTPPAVDANSDELPVQTLAAFARVALAPGEARRVTLTLAPAQLAAAASGALGSGPNGEALMGIACGEYELRVGSLSARLVLGGEVATAADVM